MTRPRPLARDPHLPTPALPSVLHEALRELVTQHPGLLRRLLPANVGLAEGPLVAVATELTDPRVNQLLPDAVLVSPDATTPRVALIVEIQLSVAEPKRRVWPQYAAAAHCRYACAATVVVVTPDAKVEEWARRPIEIGPGHVMTPWVVGPGRLPRLPRREVDASPKLALLSTLAHITDPSYAEQALWTFETLARPGRDVDGRLADILDAALSAAIRERMEELMQTGKYEYRSDFAKKYFARGRQEGRQEGQALGQALGQARALLLILRSRGLSVPEDAVARIEAERDEATLDAWTRRALDVADVSELFDPA